MDVSKEQRHAFLSVAKHRSFTKAAKELNLTQAALSIRIKNLENTLSCSLFVRSRTGLTLTDAAIRFLEYAKTLDNWEAGWWADFNKTSNGLNGEIKIGAFSTIGRSLVLPSLSGLLSKNPEVNFNFFVKELRELPQLLLSGEADFVFFR